jgi:hypothetical protein
VTQIRSGYRARRDIGAEFRLIEERAELAATKRALMRLRGAVRDHLEHPSGASLARLRHELANRTAPAWAA